MDELTVVLKYRPELDKWQADFGDHHGLGDTKARAIMELGLYLVRRETTGVSDA